MAKKIENAAQSTVETVNLVGTVGQKTGEHGVYADGKLVALFRDGVAEVEHDVAELFRKFGYVE